MCVMSTRTKLLAHAVAIGAALTVGAWSAHAQAHPPGCQNVIGKPPCDAPSTTAGAVPPSTEAPPTTSGCHNAAGGMPCDAPSTTAGTAPPSTETPPTTPGCRNVIDQAPCDAPSTSSTVPTFGSSPDVPTLPSIDGPAVPSLPELPGDCLEPKGASTCGPTPPASATPTMPPATELPVTGGSVALAVLAAVTLALGIALVFVARRGNVLNRG